MLKYQEILDYALNSSGLFFAGLESTMIDKERFIGMIKVELALYSKYKPLERKMGANLYNNKSFSIENDMFVPENITHIRRAQTNPFLMHGQRYGEISSYHWKYEKPVLLFNYPRDVYEVTFTQNHEYNEQEDSIATLDLKDTNFMDLVTGRFMTAVGRSRASFLISDSPMDLNGSQIAADGTQMYDSAKESLQEGSYIWTAF